MTGLTVSIVNWNTREQLRRCLLSLRAAVGREARVVVVDNASSDGSAEMVAREFPEVELHALGDNLGFAGGNNVALRGAEGEYALVLNPDVQVDGAALRELMDFLDRTPDAAAVSPLLVGEDGRPHAHLYRRFPSLAQAALFWTVLGPLARRSGALRRRLFEHDLRGSEPVPVDQLPGAALLLRTSVLREVGEWDPDYFIWFEDVDWCYRVRQAGHGLYVLPRATMVHEGGASFRSWALDTRVHQFYRAYTRFLCKHRLDHLLRWSLPVLSADLAAKDALLGTARLLRWPGTRGTGTLRRTRRAMREVVARHRAGELVRLTDAGAGVSPPREPEAP